MTAAAAAATAIITYIPNLTGMQRGCMIRGGG